MHGHAANVCIAQGALRDLLDSDKWETLKKQSRNAADIEVAAKADW